MMIKNRYQELKQQQINELSDVKKVLEYEIAFLSKTISSNTQSLPPTSPSATSTSIKQQSVDDSLNVIKKDSSTTEKQTSKPVVPQVSTEQVSFSASGYTSVTVYVNRAAVLTASERASTAKASLKSGDYVYAHAKGDNGAGAGLFVNFKFNGIDYSTGVNPNWKCVKNEAAQTSKAVNSWPKAGSANKSLTGGTTIWTQNKTTNLVICAIYIK